MPLILTKTADFNDDFNFIFGENFNSNCENLSKIMRMIGWRWADAVNGYPSPTEIKNTIYRLYKDLIFDFENSSIDRLSEFRGCFIISTGGFTMELYYDLKAREIQGLNLKFDIWGHEPV